MSSDVETQPAPTAPTEMLIEGGWTLELSEGGLRLSKEGESSIELPRAKLPALIERTWLEFSRPFFIVLAPKRMTFRLSPQQASDLQSWLGPDYGPELQHQLKRRMGMAIPFGLIWVITAPGNPISWVLGGIMVLEGLLQRLRPSHWLFLIEAVFWVVMLEQNGERVFNSARSGSMGGLALWAGFGLLSATCLSVSVRMFRIFRRTLHKP